MTYDQGTNRVLVDIAVERTRQTERWGEQTHPILAPDGNAAAFGPLADDWKARNAAMATGLENGPPWAGILFEEVFETFAETDPRKIRDEAVQAAAVLVAMIEQIDREHP